MGQYQIYELIHKLSGGAKPQFYSQIVVWGHYVEMRDLREAKITRSDGVGGARQSISKSGRLGYISSPETHHIIHHIEDNKESTEDHQDHNSKVDLAPVTVGELTSWWSGVDRLVKGLQRVMRLVAGLVS